MIKIVALFRKNLKIIITATRTYCLLSELVLNLGGRVSQWQVYMKIVI